MNPAVKSIIEIRFVPADLCCHRENGFRKKGKESQCSFYSNAVHDQSSIRSHWSLELGMLEPLCENQSA